MQQQKLQVGQRVQLDNGSKKYGTLRFLGSTRFRPGVWAGIEMDTPEGRHDGTVEGVQYFKCPPLHGVFVHPSKLSPVESAPELLESASLEFPANPIGQASHLPPNDQQQKSMFPIDRLKNSQKLNSHGSNASILNLKNENPLNEIIFNLETTQALELVASPDENKKQPWESANLKEMEEELRRRQVDMMDARAVLEAYRMQIAGPHEDAQEYLAHRDELIAAVDLYERSVGKYERQMRRVSYLYMQSGLNSNGGTTTGQTFSEPKEIFSEIVKRPNNDSSSIRDLQEKLERQAESREKQFLEDYKKKLSEEYDRKIGEEREKQESLVASLQQQLRQHSTITAQLNVERAALRKESGELRTHLTRALSEAAELRADKEAVKIESSAVTENDSDETNQLRSQNNRLSQELNEIRMELESLKDASLIVDNSGNMESEKDIIAQVQKAIIEQQAVINQLQEEHLARLAEVELERDQLRAECAQAAHNLLLLQDRNNLVSSFDSNDLNECCIKREQVHNLQIESIRQNLEDNWTRFTRDLRERDDLISSLRQQLSSVVSNSSDQELLDQLFNANKKLEAEYEALQSAKEREEVFFSRKIQYLESLDKVDSRNEEVERLTGERDALLARLGQISAEKIEIEDRLHIADAQATENANKVAVYRELLDARANDISRLEDAYREVQRRALLAEQSIEISLDKNTDSDIEKLRSELEEARIALSRRRQESHTVDSMIQERQDLLSEIDRCRLEIIRLRADSTATPDLEKVLGTLNDERNRNKELSDKLIEREARLSVLEEEISSRTIVTSGDSSVDDRVKSLEKNLRHRDDMIELAEREMNALQARLQNYEEMERQMDPEILQKYNQILDENSILRKKLDLSSAFDSNPLKMDKYEHKSDVGENLESSDVLAASTNVQLKTFSDSEELVSKLNALERQKTAIEHEKKLIESELLRAKERISNLTLDSNVLMRQQKMLHKAANLLTDLRGRHGLPGPIIETLKSIASLARLYRPIKVDVEALGREFDDILKTLPSPKIKSSKIDNGELNADSQLSTPNLFHCPICGSSADDLINSERCTPVRCNSPNGKFTNDDSTRAKILPQIITSTEESPLIESNSDDQGLLQNSFLSDHNANVKRRNHQNLSNPPPFQYADGV